MWRFEICWLEEVEGVNFPITCHKGFGTRKQYERCLKRLKRHHRTVIGKIEDFKRVL